MTHYRFIAAATICSALALQAACAIGRGIQETLGAMASGGEPPPYRYELVPPKGQVVPSSATVHWASSDTSVATVVNGWVVGKKVGVASISATADGVRGNAKVTVRPKTQPGG